MKREMKEKKKGNSILPIILFSILGILVFFGWEKKKNSEKMGFQQEEIRFSAMEAESENMVSEEEEETAEKVIVRPKITVGDIVVLIFEEGKEGISYSLIETEGRGINITGEAMDIEDVYRLESALRSHGARRINSDYIKVEEKKVQFKMDFDLQNYGKDKPAPYLSEDRRIFATPTEQKTVLSRMVSRRCEIISIGRSQKQEFNQDMIETGIPYHIRGDIYQIINLFFDIEESRVFLSLLENPIKIIVNGDEAEVHFKVTGYSRSFS
ncbi:MAG: hypothetical protein ACRCTS_04250 [Fusobacteriaceae bacterium]